MDQVREVDKVNKVESSQLSLSTLLTLSTLSTSLRKHLIRKLCIKASRNRNQFFHFFQFDLISLSITCYFLNTIKIDQVGAVAAKEIGIRNQRIFHFFHCNAKNRINDLTI